MKQTRERYPREKLHMIVDQIDEPYLVEAIEQLKPFLSKSMADERKAPRKKK